MCPRKPNQFIEVEQEISKAIVSIGGVKIDTFFRKTSQKNADFLFDKYSVIAELKVLKVDQIKNKKNIDKATDIYRRLRDQGKIDVAAYGRIMLTTDGFPKDFKSEVADLYLIPLRRVIRDANEQIKSTK